MPWARPIRTRMMIFLDDDEKDEEDDHDNEEEEDHHDEEGEDEDDEDEHDAEEDDHKDEGEEDEEEDEDKEEDCDDDDDDGDDDDDEAEEEEEADEENDHHDNEENPHGESAKPNAEEFAHFLGDIFASEVGFNSDELRALLEETSANGLSDIKPFTNVELQVVLKEMRRNKVGRMFYLRQFGFAQVSLGCVQSYAYRWTL